MLGLGIALLVGLAGLPLGVWSVPAPAHKRASGCGSKSPWDFNDNDHFNKTLGDRSFLVHIPQDYSEDVKHPVILSYHGFKSNDIKQEDISGFSLSYLQINSTGIIAVYPDGAFGPGKDGSSPERAWQGAPYAKDDVDDIKFTLDVIKEVKENMCVDDQRIYAAGKSNGGGFTHMLACNNETTAVIAAFAPVSPALYAGTNPLSDCDPGRQVPILSFHGLADDITPYEGRQWDNETGNPTYALPAIPDWRAGWATRNGCKSIKGTFVTHPDNITTRTDWLCSESHSRAVVKGFTIEDLGHSWPTIHGLDGDSTPFSATITDIVPFFNNHTLDG